ncbi:MAG: DUF4446 family protein [Actinobacteria bacterium]|nr:DUF4446 family protein [Thermoleophilia bacterium]MCB9011104.1 DUF4446 family protein [Actinomycetota bacterium]
MEPYLVAASVAAVPGVLALGLAVWGLLRLRRVRAAQSVLLPDGTSVTLADRQAELRTDLSSVESALADLRSLVDAQAETTARELAKSLRYQGLVRYDAYGDMGGRQSWSVALLDDAADGTVMSCLHARDHARVYMKEISGGASAQRLSPEEERAITLATDGRDRLRKAAEE